MSQTLERVKAFCSRFGLETPICLAPMAGSTPPPLSIAVTDAGGLGACGVLLMTPAEIETWARDVRASSQGPFQLNTWIPGPSQQRNPAGEARIREFLAAWGPAVAADAGNAVPPDFTSQCDAMLEARPAVVSSIMGLFSPAYVRKLKERGVAWFAVATTVAEARAAEAAGADVIVAQGSEAGGHRGAFDASLAERQLVGLVALVPAIVNAVRAPVVATGGIADGRGVAAALVLGASAVQIGTAFLRCPEAGTNPVWAAALSQTAPEETVVSRVFTGRPGRTIATKYVRAATASDAPPPAPYPVQRGLTTAMRTAAQRDGNIDRMQMWAGQAAALGRSEPAQQMTRRIWEEARALVA